MVGPATSRPLIPRHFVPAWYSGNKGHLPADEPLMSGRHQVSPCDRATSVVIGWVPSRAHRGQDAGTALMAAPTMPASFCSVAGTTVARKDRRGRNLSDFLLMPPPTMIRSGDSSASIFS